MGAIGEPRGADPTVVLEYRLVQIGISVYGYLKRVGAIRCVQTDKDSIPVEDALRLLEKLIRRTHSRLTWAVDVEKRITEIRLGDFGVAATSTGAVRVGKTASSVSPSNR